MKQYTVDVTYGIVCGAKFTVEARTEEEAREKAACLAHDTDMTAHMIDGDVTDLRVVDEDE